MGGEPGPMSMDSALQKHYAMLLGVGSPWEVKNVVLSLEAKQVEIELGWQWGAAAPCPDCGRACSVYDCAPERTWRHLDTMQFTTILRARTPRVSLGAKGEAHGAGFSPGKGASINNIYILAEF